MKVTFIRHSCFLVEIGERALLFDYYDGSLPEISGDSELLVFSSHAHWDHFSDKIFEPGIAGGRTRYFLSDDISREAVPEDMLPRVTFVSPHRTIWLSQGNEDEIRIDTLKSNDLGTAFVIRQGEEAIYHAGDLNNWWWDGDALDMRLADRYHRELQRIRGMHFKAAFVPLDPRLKGYDLGIRDFLEYCTADHLFPMHFAENFGVIDKFLSGQGVPGFAGCVERIGRFGQSFEL